VSADIGLWRRERDSNPRTFRSTVFKTAALNHSAIPPRGNLAQREFPCQDDRSRLAVQYAALRHRKAEGIRRQLHHCAVGERKVG
jgi:hypothetical protein